MKERFYSRYRFPEHQPFKDSAKARNRIVELARIAANEVVEASTFSISAELIRKTVHQILLREVGTEVPTNEYKGWSDASWLKSASIADLLDYLTVFDLVYRSNMERLKNPGAHAFRERLNKIFRQEHLAYSMDETGSIHDLIDLEFERSTTETLKGLENARYSAVLDHYKNALSALVPEHPNWRNALREAFDACECLFKLMHPGVNQLKSNFLKEKLTPTLMAIHKEDAEARRTALKALEAFANIVDGAHNYRHAKAAEETCPMPDDLGLLYFGSLATFLRWLVSIDLPPPQASHT